MGKRSNFERNPRDYYKSPLSVVGPLVSVVTPRLYIEPCAGDGALIDHLDKHGFKCVGAYDIEPQRSDIKINNALTNVIQSDNVCYITNPPWDRKFLHPFIEKYVETGNDVWALFDADWMHTKQSTPYMKWCHTIISVGRVRWIPNSNSVGKDNCSWYGFNKNNILDETRFYGRI